ncbi:hypothetical protein H0X06_02975 [Candidatus Dependentiae bacterium]|nr:hypothetical protein [Candidatus Dependentiae bacterium]
MKAYSTVFLRFHMSIMLGACFFGSLIGQPAWDDTLNLEQIEYRLKTEKITAVSKLQRHLKKDSNTTRKAPGSMKLVVLESGLQAVFKPDNYKSVSGTDEYCYAEVAAYKASRVMGKRLVPPTVIREIEGRPGSLQFFVQPAMKTTTINKAKIGPKDQSDIEVFYFVFGQWDLHNGNQIIAESKGKIFVALIDNATMMHVQKILYGHHAFIKKGYDANARSQEKTPFPFDQVKIARRSNFKDLYPLFSRFISKYRIEKMERKRRVPYIVWDNALWLQHYKFKGQKPCFTKTYYRSTLNALKALNRESLLYIWQEGLSVNKKFEELIDLTLERRDQLVKAAETSGTILDDTL